LSERTLSLTVDEDAAGQRLDAFVSAALGDLSRSRIKALIDNGFVKLEGEPARPSRRVLCGHRVDIVVPPPPASDLTAQDIPLDVLYEDAHLVVLHKPAGLVVHPGAGNPDGTLANALRHHYPQATVGGEQRPGIVHRLDKETSGVMVCALDDDTHHALTDAFRAREVDKLYVAFCIGRPKKPSFESLTGHRRAQGDRRRYTTKLPPPEEDEGGPNRVAHSRFRVIASAAGASELEVELLTGRTHQIRAHLADLGFPIICDELYGGAKADKRLPPGPVRDAARALERQALHAARLGFVHPATGERMEFEAPLPADLARLRSAIVEAQGA
jgi:23S rRNA pseudouridine1911/1915/1917 synthase